uniref:Auxin-responsive protein SAUR72-like n=1 Tax=Tanacetum cinerariifolium TaxID=118510 RepID=A0A6L2NYG0_TANCI|nr:auxin-responsive protein SAUR72-like [Tanacetum cinerariifolium]
MADNSSSALPPTNKKSSNKIRDIVRLQQMLKKWKKAATVSKNNNNNNAAAASTISTGGTKGLNKFLKKTLSFSDISSSVQEDVVRKGYLAVWVGRDEDDMKKFVIPTDYLAHQAFSLLLRDAEDEFGFQQEGILKIPCDIPLFEEILKTISTNTNDNKKQLKSSSSTSSFFLYEQEQPQSEPAPHNYHHQIRSSAAFDSKLKTTPPTTPAHNLPLYCR